LPDDKNRAVGIILNEKPIVKKVLTKKQAAVSTISFLNTSYLASFLPIVNVEDQPIGILSVAQKETEVLRSAIFAIQKTFLSTVLLLFISVFPVYLIAKYLESQMS
jgi:sensor histidine kinase regulating citrate/malate metabolism